MAKPNPFSSLEDFLQKLPLPPLQPPEWALSELRRRVVLWLNHVLMQEPEAMSRLLRHKGQVMQVQWRAFDFKLAATPAGLLDVAANHAKPDLVLTLTDTSPLTLAQSALRGDKPAVRIEGDVQLAAEVNWLAEHVRWDVEEDLARVIGDVPAHTLSQIAAKAMAGLRQFASATSRFVPGKAV